MRTGHLQDQQNDNYKIFYELSALVMNILRSPPERSRESPSFEQITPAGFASLLMGISLALMLCGSLTFLVGFILMPWVLGLALILYLVWSISIIGRAILPSPPEDAPSWKL